MRRCGPIHDSLDLRGVGRYSSFTNHMPQVSDRSLSKCALRLLEVPIISCQPLQNLAQVNQVRPEGTAVHQNIVEEDDYKLPKAACQGCIHGPLECARSSSQPKRHDFEFILAKVSLECCLMFFPLLKQNLVEPSSKVQFREPTSL